MAEQGTNSAAGRPLPDLDSAPSDSATATQQAELDSDDDEHSSGGGRRHVSASVSKTLFSVNTPASQKRAIQRLKQSLTFSDNSSHSSAASTPQKNGPTQSGQGSTHSLQSSTQSAPPTFATGQPVLTRASPRDKPGDEGEGSEYISEGEAPTKISITAIMSKLEQVKSYLQEAQALHQQMKERLSEPGMAVQVNKMGRLVEDLRRQESGYLSILVKLLDQQPEGGPVASSSQVGTAESEGSEGGGSSEGEGLSDGELADEERGKGNDSMSLKAELLKEKMETQQAENKKQEEELRMLREQRDLLRKLVEQQRQIQSLEARQKSLMLVDGRGTTDTPAAGPGTQASLSVGNGAGEPSQREDQARDNANDEMTESAIGRRLEQLRERQARVEQLTTLLQQLQTDTDNMRQSQVHNSSSDGARAATGQIAQPQGGAGSDELVAVERMAVPAEMLEIQQKLRQAQEAREKLTQLQQMISLLQETGEESSSGSEGEGVTQPPPRPPPPPASSRQSFQTGGQGHHQHQQQQEEEEGEEEEDGETESGGGELEASVLSEYKERLVRRRREVRELQEQRDRLLATQRKLQHLQQTIADNASPPSSKHTASTARDQSVNPTRNGEGRGEGEGVLSSEELASELGRQRRLYDELLDKTQQIQSMVDEVTGARDISGATWGGSSSEEEEEEEEVSSVTGLDDTRDDQLEHTFTGTLGESAVAVVGGDEEGHHRGEGGGGGGGGGEGVVFRVTRHTPHHVRGGQRRLLTPEISPHTAGKRMKLDTSPATPMTGGVKGHSVSVSGATGGKPAIGSLSAAWPGVIFPTSSRKHTREEATQTGRELVSQQSLTETHVSFLHHQLASTSALAGQLLSSQQTLVGSVCRQLETQQLATCFQDHFARLHHYQNQLEQQYQQLQAAFYKLELAAEEQQQDKEDEEEDLGRYQEEPVLHDRPPSPLPPFTSSTLPTAPPDTHQSNNARGRPSQPANEKRERDNFDQSATNPSQETATMSSSRQRQRDPRRYSSMRMPPPPGTYLPHLYQPVPPDRREPDREEEREESVDNDAMPAGYFPPPPPLPPYLHHPSPYHYPPPHLYPPWVPPTPQFNMSVPHLQTSPSYNVGPTLSPHPNPYPNFRLSWPPPHHSGVSPIYPGHTPYDSFVGGPHMYGSNYPLPHMGGGYGDMMRGERGESRGQQRVLSPSGVTGVSMQVQPPSSPPSAPSVSNLPQTTSSGPSTGSGLLQQLSTGAVLPPAVSTSVSQTGPASLSLPKLTSHTSARSHPLPSVLPWSVGAQQAARGRDEEGEQKKVTTTQDEESLSSLPLSLPDTSKRETGREGEERPPEDFSVFDALRDTIYSEVATLIANNENRPHFLVELFRELQMLSSDYLRQRALYCLQDLVTRYLTEENLQGRHGRNTTTGLEASWSEQTPSESLVTSDDEFGRPARGEREGRREEGEEEESGSSNSTPRKPRDKAPFATDTVGDNVVRLDKAMARLRESYGMREASGNMQPPVVSPGPLQKHSDINTEELDEQIKAIMTEVIPVLKEHMAKSCSPELLQQIRQLVMELTLTQLKEQIPSAVGTFSRQLDTALENALQKYLNQMLKECGEALLVEVSEVLFNELAFFRLAQTMGVQREPKSEATSVTTIESEKDGERGGEGEEEGGRREREMAAEVLPVLQALTKAVEKTLSEEQEALGKTRDDELAREWSGPQDRPSSPSLDEDQTIIVELSASETKPIDGVGSGEEEGNGEGEESKATSQTSTTAADAIAKTTGEREDTPPTPVVAAVTGTSTGTASTQSPPPKLSSSDAKLGVQMKLEQQSTGGIAGILASMEQEPELAGESDQLPEPAAPSEAVAEP